MYFCICMSSRRAGCDAFFSRLGVKPTYVTPVDKHKIKVQELISSNIVSADWTRRTPLPGGSREFEVACALSHLNACKAIVESDLDFAFVFEDDNVDGCKCVRRFTDLQLWASLNHHTFNLINVSPCNSLHTLKKGMLSGTQGCTNSLLYSRKGAQYVVDNILPIRSPIDDWLHLNMPDGRCLHPRIFKQDDELSIVSVLNPMLCKHEYLFNIYTVMSYGCSAAALVMSVWYSMCYMW